VSKKESGEIRAAEFKAPPGRFSLAIIGNIAMLTLFPRK
jgi:hypothetical protein